MIMISRSSSGRSSIVLLITVSIRRRHDLYLGGHGTWRLILMLKLHLMMMHHRHHLPLPELKLHLLHNVNLIQLILHIHVHFLK